VKNQLPFNGAVYYHGKVFTQHESDAIFSILNNQIEWKHDEVMLFGKKITTKRKMAWYGDAGKKYTYSSIERIPLPWTEQLLHLKKVAEEKTLSQFNTCLLNYYASGEEAMGWHSDNESMLIKHSTIASFSFGAERKFSLKHNNSKQKVDFLLENGSLLSMENEIQDHWKHALTKSMSIKQARINLTFRLIK
jgi:alkylated DNA repair dioxygenase AlkB